MSTPTVDTLQTQVNAMLVRIAVLDGQGLVSPVTGFVQQTDADITGLKNDIDGSALALEGLINNLSAQVQALQASVDRLLSLSGITTSASWVTPPTT